jgi:hypothetical protein
MQCPDCGANYSGEDLFCGECGRPLSTETRPDESPNTPRAPDKATGMPAPAPTAPQPTRSRSKLAVKAGGAALILLVLCIIGVVILFSILGDSASNAGDNMPTVGDRLLYQDDFRDPASGWDAWDNGGTSGTYVDGGYRLAVNLEDYMAWSHPADTKELKDFAIEVDARQVDGSLDSTFGPIVRVQAEEEQYYWFQISGDGYYSVELKEDDEWIRLAGWQASSAIKQGLDATNRIRVICYGDRFSLYVNGTHLTDVTDDTLRAGIIGLAAGAYTEPPVVVHFDNLVVYELQD